MNTYRVALMSCLVAGWAAGSLAQTNIVLTPDADTYVRRYQGGDAAPDLNFGGGGGLNVRSFTGVRQWVTYIRFDLRGLTSAPQTGMVFRIERGAGNSMTAGQLQLYGLPDQFGNTPQEWLELGLTWNGTGNELPGNDETGAADIDYSRLVYISDFPASTGASNEFFTFSTEALDSFVSDRWANGGLATLIIAETENANRILGFTSREGGGVTNGPILELVGTLGPIPTEDTKAPTVAFVIPTNGAVGVAVDTRISASFSEPMDGATVTNGTPLTLVDDSLNPVSATVSYNPGTFKISLVPDALLDPLTTYTVTVPTGPIDLASNAFASSFSWSFTTVSADLTPPSVVSVTPTNGTVEADYWVSPTATFDEAINPSTITTGTFYMVDSSNNPVEAAVLYDENTMVATLAPVPVLLDGGETYTVHLLGGPGGVADVFANTMTSNAVWSFTTKVFDPAAPILLVSDADSDNQSGANSGAAGVCRVEGFGGAPDFYAYIRFDLSGYQDVAGAELWLLKTAYPGGRGDNYAEGRFEVWGLENIPGNTPQDWSEAVDIVVGTEVLTNVVSGRELNTNLLFTLDNNLGANTLENESSSIGGDVDVFLSGPDLDVFLNERIADGGLVTFIVRINQDGRGYGFASKENQVLAPPRLQFYAAIQPPITGIAAVAGPAIAVTWEGLSSHTYALERTVGDLTVSNWVAVASNLGATASNTYTDTAPVGVWAAYRVLDEGVIELFSDDFDGADMGWTAETDGTTSWQLGTPTLGPGAAQSPPNSYVTNLGGDYGSNADVSLISPVIDLSAVGSALLSFDHYMDFEPFVDPFGDYAEVYVRDDAGGEIPALAAPIARYEPQDLSPDWEAVLISLPAQAVGRTIKIEFRFVSDSGTEFTGWYIDNVGITP